MCERIFPPTEKNMNAADQRGPAKSLMDGRDEMNLSEFPISVLQRQQPKDDHGTKLDRVSYESSRYDPARRHRVIQRVVLETHSRHGLPTPADENVVLALLFVAKHAHNFSDPSVHFTPRQLFRIMGWAPNSRSYDRLRAVLRRLKALVIRYENSWWDASDRGYEAEFATGIISEYELARQVAGRKKQGEKPANWVRWSPHFQQSLAKGNLKKLNLEQLFALRLPTSQRMYRFLDKRFYPRHQPPSVEMDLWDFACGHVGLSRVDNVAELKRRISPAIKELEGIEFIARAEPKQRYHKVSAGVWRIRFDPGAAFEKLRVPAPPLPKPPPTSTTPSRPNTPPTKLSVYRESEQPDRQLAERFYQLKDGSENASVGPGDIAHARQVIQRFGLAHANALVPCLVEIVRRKWADCRSFSGAATKYLADAVTAQAISQRRGEQRQQTAAQQVKDRDENQRQTERRRQLEFRWNSLPAEQQTAIEQDVLQNHPELQSHPGILKGFCMNKLM
jgi:hypothetical protein